MNTTIRSKMSLIMDVIRPELSKLSALELENLPYLTVYTLASANINLSVSNKLGHSVYDHKISDKFDYGYNQTRPSGVICP